MFRANSGLELLKVAGIIFASHYVMLKKVAYLKIGLSNYNSPELLKRLNKTCQLHNRKLEE